MGKERLILSPVVHLINTVQEVIGGSGYAVTAHAKSAICAFISGVICSTVKKGIRTICSHSPQFLRHSRR